MWVYFRYDHFLPLCDLLPQAIPSLVFNLQLMQFGTLQPQQRLQISKSLCVGNTNIPWDIPFLVNVKLNCSFPGYPIYETLLPLNFILFQLKATFDNVDKYSSPLNLDYSYFHKQRVADLLKDLQKSYISLNNFRKKFISVSEPIYYDDTINEWLIVYLTPYLDKVYDLINKLKEGFKQNDWKPRPLPVTLRTYPDIIN